MINALSISAGGIAGAVIGALGGVVLLLFLISFLVFRRLFSRPKAMFKPNAITYKMMGKDLDKLNEFIAKNMAELKKRECENISVTSEDGLKLNGYLYKCGKPTDKVVLLSHGFNSSCYNTYSAQALFYLDNGFDVYMLNHRAHEKSEGAYSAFSIKEGGDILKWVELIVNRQPDAKIMLHGNSMGAASVMEASCLDLPANVKCIISDCGFTSAYDELSYQMKYAFHVPLFPILNIICLLCKTVAKFDLKSVSALESVKKARVPIMFVHGTSDATVPHAMGQQNFDACCTEKRLVLYENTGHGASYFKNTEAYQKEILDFTDTYLK